ncbi:MAG: rhomboid family intramembrane serine protease [Pseudomonadales bacterium]
MFPLSDDNPRIRPPVATVAIITINALVWLLLQGMGAPQPMAESLCLYGLIPGDLLGTIEPGTTQALSDRLVCRLDGRGSPLSLLTSMFMHGGWFHIIGNMWFLWVFGDNVEDVMGPGRFIGFYLLCGLAAAAAQIIADTNSTLPMVGASGAIGGVMGAYALLFPRVRVNTLIFLGFYITTIRVPAIFMLGYWFLIQLIQGLPALGSQEGGVAFWAHIGGFVAGVALIRLFARADYLRARGSVTGPIFARKHQKREDGRWF